MEVRMQNLRRYKGALILAAAALVPLGIAGILIPFRSTFAATASALLFVAVIVAIAVLGDRITGILATVSSTLWFDLFLTRPYERLAITHRADIETAVSLFIVGVVVTELAARNRDHHSLAAQEADYLGLMYEFSELVASGAPADEVIDRMQPALTDLLGLRSCRYERGPRSRARLMIERDGLVFLGGNVWDVDNLGLPGPEIELQVHGRGAVLGRFVLAPTPGQPVPFQRRVVAIALADQVGAALVPQLRSA
jgi:K+-sensing histidine kinase KdpD